MQNLRIAAVAGAAAKMGRPVFWNSHKVGSATLI